MKIQIKRNSGSKIRSLLISSIAIFSFFAVQSSFSQNSINKFSDPVIREIHDLADRRDSLALLPFLRDSNPNYRGEALMCFGSVQSIGLIDSIAPALNSDFNGIRIAAAFALGQTFHTKAVPYILSAIERDTVKLVKGMLFDALGKCGEESHLQWLAAQNVDFQESEGQAQGILRFALRGIIMPEGNSRMVEIIKKGSSTVGVIFASYHLGRYTDTLWLSNNVVELEELYRNERDPLVSSNLIMAIIKARQNEAWPYAEDILQSDADYREKVNILKTLGQSNWDKARKLIYKLAIGQDPNLAVAAAEAIERNAGKEDLRKHLKAISKVKNWRARALLLGRAMEISIDKKNLPGKIGRRILAYYTDSENNAEKAWLLKCLVSSPEKYGFVEQQLNNRDKIVSTYAMETLTLMAKHENCNQAKEKLAAEGIDLNKEFLRIFRSGISSGDIAIISMAASILRDPQLAYIELITDVGFLERALEQTQTPDLIEAKNELLATLAYLSGKKEAGKTTPVYNHPIDWERVMRIPSKQLLGFNTSKGEILVQLNVNWCPGTVSAFLELVEEGFYDNKTIHRVVPNFVVQDGCPRGDGWGGPPFSIRSEFTPAPFLPGVLGMASSGKDTEGSQWFLTHTATPHLDGKYTNFGFVVSGMEVVHQLEVGDVIERVVVIK